MKIHFHCKLNNLIDFLVDKSKTSPKIRHEVDQQK